MRAWRLANLTSEFQEFSTNASRNHGEREERGNQVSVSPALAAALGEAQTPYFQLARGLKQQYCRGLFNLHLPTSEMNVITNGDVSTQDYILSKDSKMRVASGRSGEYGGFLSAYWTFPEDDSSVVVLCNSYQINGDPTNIVAQLLVQALFDLKPAVDFVEVAKNIVQRAKRQWDTVISKWTSHRLAGTSPKPLSAYTGTFVNKQLALRLEFSINQGVPEDGSDPTRCPLHLPINGNDEQVFGLYHYHDGSWSFFLATRDDNIHAEYSGYFYC
ncbi:hypothetical protein B0H63DRAFT_477413 [Podospora didyma]|uniref:Beta-lactamase-related domain-containing protein n=1 Tax=Podospora didyma TaxID=330526 RepID=A0AAE0KK77_9PEZI|nr:hypothetical protein B0H63DRAFT_477413 [Podospora didyma]